MECARCGDKEQAESFCTNCGAPMSGKFTSVPISKPKNSKRLKIVSLCGFGLLALLLLIGFYGRGNVLSSISGLYTYGDYRALLAKCPFSGIDIYWAPIHVDDGRLDSLEDGSTITYNNVVYSVSVDPYHHGSAHFATSLNNLDTEDILGCGE